MNPENLEPITRVARQLFPGSPLTVERVREGGSTWVYRLRRADETFYLRLLPDAAASFAPEVSVHKILKAKGAAVPDVVFFEHRHEALGRSVMVTTEIPGRALGHGLEPGRVSAVLRAAGRDLALIGSIPVEGFGWLKRDEPEPSALQGEHPTSAEGCYGAVDAYLALLEDTLVLSSSETETIRDVRQRYGAAFQAGPACLAHGDFDATHIYTTHIYTVPGRFGDSRYSGVIDFGEIRGAHPLYDLAQFSLETGNALPYLLEGYAERTPLPPDYRQRTAYASLFMALERVGRRQQQRPGTFYKPYLSALRRSLELLK